MPTPINIATASQANAHKIISIREVLKVKGCRVLKHPALNLQYAYIMQFVKQFYLCPDTYDP